MGTVESSQLPEIPMQKQAGIRFPAIILREAIRRAAFADTTEQIRFTISGAKIVVDDRSLTMVATDGHRLALMRFPLAGSAGQKLDLLVPKKTLLKFEDLLDREIRRDAESQIEIGDNGNQLCFAIGNHSLYSRTLTGTSPNWIMVLPKNLACVAEIGAEDFRRSLSRVTLTAEGRNYSVTMEIESGKLPLRSSTAEGEAREEMLAAFSGERGLKDVYSLRFNSRYLMDFLRVVSKTGSPTFSFGFNDANSPF